MRYVGWSQADALKRYAVILLRKMGFIAIGWLLVYFLTQPFRADGSINMLMLFAPVPGAIAGLVAGWYMATDAVEESSLQGIVLWVLLVLGSVVPMWCVEGLLRLMTGWPLNFGGFMLLTASNVMALATAVWHASSQE